MTVPHFLFTGEDFVLRQLRPTDSVAEIYLLGWSADQTLPHHYEEGTGLHIRISNVTYGMLEHAWTFVLLFVDVP